MKKKLVLYFSLLLFQFTLAQSLLQLSTGKISIQPTSAFNIDQLRKQQQPIAGKLFVLLQFRKTLTTQEFKQLSDLGIQLLEYIPPFSYVSSINSTVPKNIFQQTNIVGIANIPSSFKLSPVLKQPEKYDWLQGANGRMDVLIKISTGISIADAKKYLEQNGFTLSPSPFESYSILQDRKSVV